MLHTHLFPQYQHGSPEWTWGRLLTIWSTPTHTRKRCDMKEKERYEGSDPCCCWHAGTQALSSLQLVLGHSLQLLTPWAQGPCGLRSDSSCWHLHQSLHPPQILHTKHTGPYDPGTSQLLTLSPSLLPLAGTINAWATVSRVSLLLLVLVNDSSLSSCWLLDLVVLTHGLKSEIT